ncbi:hypothetical protein BMS3Bbin01_01772 [bacterium BMS3Bbin01]|nr:hypothetical protein BMS3Bbin01_01772 [bacterium BMS3Bbin01]
MSAVEVNRQLAVTLADLKSPEYVDPHELQLGDRDCTWDGITDSRGTLDFVANAPTVHRWTDTRIYCER